MIRITLSLAGEWPREIIDDLLRVVVCVRLLGLGNLTVERGEEDGFTLAITPSSEKARRILLKILKHAREFPYVEESGALLTVEET